MQAAAASMLELPLESVPDFGNMPGDPYARMAHFFEAFGFELKKARPNAVLPGYYFVTGISTQGHEHIVIASQGRLVHDPNPHGGGLVKRDAAYWPDPQTEKAAALVIRRRAPIAADAAVVEEAAAILRPVHPNEGIRAWYREQIVNLARRMLEDIEAELAKHYRPAKSRLAQDDDPIVTLRTVMRVWGRLWQKKFDDLSKEIAKSFAGRTARYTDAAIRRRMREAGFTVRFRPTPRQISAYRAVIAENVGLIRSIPQQFLKDVESAVWSSVQRGGTMGELSKTIRTKYGVTYRRAALIARDQVMKSKSVLENARRAEIGITEAIWQHSSAGKEPRPTHVRMSGKRFKIADGMYDSAEQRNVQPGELINCRCTSRAIIPKRLASKSGS
jgi:SPP1 gp7 family putative phage head morphogenesis protein